VAITLWRAQAVATTASAIVYTVPASTWLTICSIRVCNTTSGDVKASLHLTPDGTEIAGTFIYDEYNIPANSTIGDDGRHNVPTTGTVEILASANTSLTFTFSGYLTT